jgi:hypothetical protein
MERSEIRDPKALTQPRTTGYKKRKRAEQRCSALLNFNRVSRAQFASVDGSIFTPGPMVEEIATRFT